MSDSDFNTVSFSPLASFPPPPTHHHPHTTTPDNKYNSPVPVGVGVALSTLGILIIVVAAVLGVIYARKMNRKSRQGIENSDLNTPLNENDSGE